MQNVECRYGSGRTKFGANSEMEGYLSLARQLISSGRGFAAYILYSAFSTMPPDLGGILHLCP